MLKPLGKRVLLSLNPVEQVSAGGLVLASAAKEDPSVGTVVAVGHLVTEEDVVKVGDSVVVSNFGGTKVQHEGKDYLVVELDEVLAVIG
ncbi:co-chaperone GroES [Tuanshanicoccus lijuaniae]|uniref:co-chaperone GroES n=1 Tax=Aerococcaceae bacterium zg-1292 TaxID=2774330 RepID=UPI001938A896|nr:co-chaperone GroES [Aerococcaceae bacterium zg-1292]MBF6625208.1 co-chaperone GroES [Aerococcaceae bacterium zg-BR9]MBF6978335.1 co-chaperone GroES [Aerococcaceae bacterium zg-BR22]MBS4456574.1 co-chaperone GroES [Aerococcaceae bacterium zg-A91]MBS4458366.1 co-chaperone GroES [Aerococcaceae bacterium zg-BR33]